MNRVVVLTKEYFPKSNGTVVVLSNILNELKEHYDVLIVTPQLSRSDAPIEKQDNLSIVRISNAFDRFYMFRESILNFLDNQHSIIRLPTVVLTKVFFVLYRTFFKRLTTIYNWENQAESIIKNQLHITKDDVFLSVGAPFENFILLAKLKQDLNNMSIALFFDLYSNNPEFLKSDFHPLELEKRRKIEKEWFTKFDKIVILSEYKKYFDLSFLQSYVNKFHFLNLPAVVSKSYINNQILIENTNAINFVYSGLFYKDIRNPQKMFEFFNQFFEKREGFLHIVGYGCQALVDEFLKNNNQAYYYGMRSIEDSMSAIYEADILINLDNTIQSQIPSKIFELISFGKPIINFYQNDNHNCKNILKDYPLSISIDLDQIESYDSYIQAISEFILEFKGQVVDKNLIHDCYQTYTPKYFVEDLVKLIKVED